MNETQNPATEPAIAEVMTTPSPPVLLREAREAAGLHIAALAAALKVPVKKLEALEAGRYAELPDMTFARALASSACRHLKVDPVPVLEQIPAARLPGLGDSAQTLNAPFKSSEGTGQLAPVWLSRPVAIIVLALLVGAVVLWFWPTDEASAPKAEATPAAEEAVMPPAPVVEPALADEPPNVGPSPEPSAAPTASITGLVSTGAEALPAGGIAAAAPVAGSDSLLNIAVSGESWVEVVNGKGDVVVQRMFKAGDVMDFTTAPPYAVTIGRADVAQVTVRGKPLDIAPYARNSVARFEVK
jgi:cytoskeleton protein RodZ